jgi:hypothetical protein
MNNRPIGGHSTETESHPVDMTMNIIRQRGPLFCDALASLYNAANMAGRKQNTKKKKKKKKKKMYGMVW